MTRSLPLGEGTDYGWAALLSGWLRHQYGRVGRWQVDQIDDAAVAIAVAMTLFVIPGGRDSGGRPVPLMDWATARRLPWGVLLLFGGGFAIAAGFEQSGLSHWCGRQLAALPVKEPLLLIAATCTLLTFLTELTSNTATTQVMLPIVARLSSAVGLHPLLLMLPATISASFAFMLPVGTPPNAIVFGSGRVPMRYMVTSGLLLNLIGIVLVTAAAAWLAAPVLGLG
jgi:sodium-dependent dicarboxylate transporter 2/3/5